MLKIDYILLIRHFQGKTFEEEDIRVTTWREASLINNLTYNRLKNVYCKERLPVKEQKITKEETKAWKKIINKILEEKET
jgi:hypothetical protein